MPSRLPNRTAADRRARCNRAALALIVLGSALRLYHAVTLPVGYDEIFVMGLGLDAMRAGPQAALLDVPMTRSTAVAPLWWWIQYIPNGLLFELSSAGLRAAPVLLGVCTLILAWHSAARSFGRRTALIFLGFCALSDILIFTNSRGEFAESLLTPLIVLLVCSAGTPAPLRRGVLGALLLLTALIKGLFVWGLALGAEAGAAIATRATRRRTPAGLAVSLLIALVPAVGFLLCGAARFQNREIQHDTLTVENVPQLLGALLFNYGAVKEHVTGGWRDALHVMLDFDVWPVTVMTAPVLLVVAIGAAVRIGRRRGRLVSRRARASAVLLIWTLVGATAIVGRGILGARFHLLYLPAAWMLAALWFGQRRAAPRARVLTVTAVVWAAFIGLTASWLDWSAATIDPRRWVTIGATLAVVVVMYVWLAAKRQLLRGPALGIAAALAMALALGVSGPSRWGRFADFEPMPRGGEIVMLDAFRSGKAGYPPAIGPRLYLGLCAYYLGGAADTPANRTAALHYARKAVDDAPDDPQAWLCLGEALLRTGGPPADIRTAWRRSLELAPNARLAERLAGLEETRPAAP